MNVGERIRAIRNQKSLSQGDIEKRTGLLRCYLSRVENGHTVPAIETLEKISRALEMPLYQLMYDGDEPPSPNPPKKYPGPELFGERGKDARFLQKICKAFAGMTDRDRAIVFAAAQEMASRR